jgi:hypothetical protein
MPEEARYSDLVALMHTQVWVIYRIQILKNS